MIPIQDARGVFTRTLIDRWNELSEIAPKSFLGSFFTKQTSSTKEVSIEVMRGTEKIAVDVLRGTDGNRNSFSRHAEKLFVPPFYNEYLDITELDRYDLLFGQNAISVAGPVIDGMLSQALEKINFLKYKIDRAYELQCAQVFDAGIVELVSGDNVDFKRKEESMVALDSDKYWSVAEIDPRVDLILAGNFLRQVGKVSAGEINVIMGSRALAAFLNNPFIINSDIKDVKLVDLTMPQATANGGIPHGKISAGPYVCYLWSYPEFYDNASDVSTPYVDDDYVYVLPVKGGRFIMSYASVPAIIRDVRNAEFPEFITQMEGDYYINNYIDAKGKKHVFEILSAGLAIPVSVDRIYSMKVTGAEPEA